MTEETLHIRQLAILEVIREHGLINFLTLKRNFVVVNDRTLRYHIKKLIDSGFIIKRGTTKGVYYQTKGNSAE